ncbi:translation initiation factor 2 [uncultured Desulfovibrio sp.]|uniref:translation initiation factor 2 n=1 Tax=uncultured Desulfovibrio sp. TaxID=167968 RepID=UPI00262622FE|nr:translation initiation factor 2 [uncultured Desulfovibrio sp.]
MPHASVSAPAQSGASRRRWFWDALFLSLAACYAWAALQGVLTISAGGAHLDSDLATYAQGMAGAAHPELFAADPVLREATPANSIWNLERFAAGLLTPGNEYVRGLFRAGALAMFVFYAGWYLAGRRLFGSPALSALLALLMGVTVWVGWGTFWGVAHSDPIPRVFFAALWPFLLLAALAAWERPSLRPPAMLAAGLCMWVHGISALNTGAMFFLAFALHRPQGQKLHTHLGNCALCLMVYFTPVLAFLWPSLTQARAFSPADMAVFQQLFSLRWQEDYGRLGERLLQMISFSSPVLPLLCGGLAGWLVVRRRGGERMQRLAAMYPAFVLALVLVVLFSWAESRFAPEIGRLPLGHELVRGLRFLAPLSWLMIVGALACFWPRLPRAGRVALAGGVMLAVLLLSHDRQHMAAQYTLSRLTCQPLPLRHDAEAALRAAVTRREALDALARLVPPGQAVFSSNDADAMAARYLALRPVAHAFKDGYIFFYNKDVQGCRNWLRYDALMRQGPTGYIDAWLASGAPWLLSHRPQDRPLVQPYGDVLWESGGWFIARRR